MKCALCEKSTCGTKNLRWFLKDYFRLTGCFCGNCYAKVAHDSSGSPKHPVAYRNAIKKLSK